MLWVSLAWTFTFYLNPAHRTVMVHQNYQNLLKITSNTISAVAFSGDLKCLHKIHVTTQCRGADHGQHITTCPPTPGFGNLSTFRQTSFLVGVTGLPTDTDKLSKIDLAL